MPTGIKPPMKLKTIKRVWYRRVVLPFQLDDYTLSTELVCGNPKAEIVGLREDGGKMHLILQYSCVEEVEADEI